MKYFQFIFSLFLMWGCNQNHSKKNPEGNDSDILNMIADANGLEAFEKVNLLEYTFNVKINDSLRTSRSWKWFPKKKRVTFLEGTDSISYNYQTQANLHAELDQQFINDQYWLLFPFHLVWDDLEYQYNKEVRSPLSQENMQQVIIRYPADVGYTPGDVYEVYFEDDYLIQEWVYRSGGSQEDPLIASWEGYEEFNGLKISTFHQNKDGSFKLYFSDIKVE